MISLTNPIFSFSIKLIVALSIAFSIHIIVLSYEGLPLYDNLIIPSYIVNAILAIIIYGFLFRLRIKYLDLLGFIYMGGSLLKFAVYFIFFNATYKESGGVSTVEAASFLVPYLTCLLFETLYLIKLLNNKL